MKHTLNPDDIITLTNILNDFKRCASEIEHELQKFLTANNVSAATRTRRSLREVEKITKRLKSTILDVKKKSITKIFYDKPEPVYVNSSVLKKIKLKDLVGTK